MTLNYLHQLTTDNFVRVLFSGNFAYAKTKPSRKFPSLKYLIGSEAANAQTIDSLASGFTTHTPLAVYSQL